MYILLCRSDLAVIDKPIIASGNKMLVIASNVRNNTVTDRQRFVLNFTGIPKGNYNNYSYILTLLNFYFIIFCLLEFLIFYRPIII